MFKKLLIANRGEIALRIIRACRELDIRTVAVYSEQDESALHVRMADEAYPIGPAPVSDSYLAVPKLLEAAQRSRAQAIHPGYGLLSENAAFVRAVDAAGLVFIGPPADAVEIMGDKAAARQRMLAAGVPVVPGFDGIIPGPDRLHGLASDLGYPILVKAAAGGGGKGMRVVWKEAELVELAAAAAREAMHAFGDDHLILERYLPHTHHIEFQVLGDLHGNVVHLFERDCSVQRRHQKIIEESPSPIVDDRLRAIMGSAAIQAARAVNYSNAGTVEFIVEPDTQEFYFLEMNTRLQVEHPVTELVTGIDLVKWQIRIAAGERLGFEQGEIQQKGHALECRLYAEDPEHSFLPASGKVLWFAEPSGPGVRVDSGITSGDFISVHYDPLIAKIIAYGEDRAAVVQKMTTALRETVLLGLTSNLQFLQDVLNHPEFLAGKVHTTWVEQNFADWVPPLCGVEPEVLIAAALSDLFTDQSGPLHVSGTDPASPWQTSRNFRTGMVPFQE